MTAFSTPQWQSFEIKMRHRRAERCLQRAQTALDAGLVNEAVEAFTEAQQLDPGSTPVQEFEKRLNALKTAPAPESRPAPYRLVALAGILLALSAFLGWQTWHRPGWPKDVTPSHADVRLESEAPEATVGSLPTPTEQAAPGSEVLEARATLPVPPADAGTAIPSPQPVEGLAPGATSTAGVTSSGTLQPVDPLKTDPAPPLRGNVSPKPDPIPTPPEVLASPSIPVPSLVAAPPIAPADSGAAATAPAPPTVAAPDQRAAIRAALARYAAAYSDLDVPAVQAVWPALDERALARAFGSLASQRVSLENCKVDVDGGSARANCSGTAAWTPKVGGGLRTTARTWVFDLSQSDGRWHIVRVQAR